MLDEVDEVDATPFVIAPSSGTVAGAAGARIDSIIQYFRKKTANHQPPNHSCLNSKKCAIRAGCQRCSTTSVNQRASV